MITLMIKDYRVRLCLTIALVALGSNFQIYHTSVVNNVQDIAETWINKTIVSRTGHATSKKVVSMYWSLTNSLVFVGGTLGSMAIGFMADRAGRRLSLVCCSIVNIAGCALISFAVPANVFAMLAIGRFLVGLSIGCGFGIASIFLTEVPPVRFRGAAGSSQQAVNGFADFVSLAITLPALLGTFTLWPIALGLPAFASAVQLIALLFFCPDSPKYLYLSKGDLSGVKRSILFYQGEENMPDTLAELKAEDEMACNDELHLQGVRAKKLGIRELFSMKPYRKPLMLALAINVGGLAMSGINVVMAYSTAIFREGGLDELTAKYATTGLGLCNAIFPLLSMMLVDRVGRRKLLLLMLFGTALSLMGLTILLCVDEYALKFPWLPYMMIVLMLIYQICYAMGSTVACFIVNELFETRLRSAASSVACFSLWFVTGLLVLAYPSLLLTVGVGPSLLPCIVSLFATGVYVLLCLPETRGRWAADVAQVFSDTDSADTEFMNRTRQTLNGSA